MRNQIIVLCLVLGGIFFYRHYKKSQRPTLAPAPISQALRDTQPRSTSEALPNSSPSPSVDQSVAPSPATPLPTSSVVSTSIPRSSEDDSEAEQQKRWLAEEDARLSALGKDPNDKDGALKAKRAAKMRATNRR